MYNNLIEEMKNHEPEITIQDIANCLHVSLNTTKKYLNGTSKISWQQSIKIQYTFFPNLEIVYLFATENREKVAS